MKVLKSVIIVKKKNQNKRFKGKEYSKVRDHGHYAGENSGAVHTICNIKYSVIEKIPIAFIIDLIVVIILS